MTLMRDNFDNVSIEKFEDLKEQNDDWTQGDSKRQPYRYTTSI